MFIFLAICSKVKFESLKRLILLTCAVLSDVLALGIALSLSVSGSLLSNICFNLWSLIAPAWIAAHSRDVITTGSFSKAAKDEATTPGKKQIDLIDGDEFISKLAEYSIGVKEVKTYEIDEDFFSKI